MQVNKWLFFVVLSVHLSLVLSLFLTKEKKRFSRTHTIVVAEKKISSSKVVAVKHIEKSPVQTKESFVKSTKPTPSKKIAEPKKKITDAAVSEMSNKAQFKKIAAESLKDLHHSPSISSSISIPVIELKSLKNRNPLGDPLALITSFLEEVILLPQKGTLDVKFRLNALGRVEMCEIHGGSLQNTAYLEKKFQELIFPKNLCQKEEEYSITLKSRF